jgi:hypothetical protein
MELLDIFLVFIGGIDDGCFWELIDWWSMGFIPLTLWDCRMKGHALQCWRENLSGPQRSMDWQGPSQHTPSAEHLDSTRNNSPRIRHVSAGQNQNS